MNVVLFIQARLKSDRLPNKMILPLCGRFVIEQALAASIYINVDRHILLTDYESYDTLCLYAHKYGFKAFSGPEENVLKRFCNAIRYFDADVVLRLTADKVIVSYEYINKMIKSFLDSDLREISFMHCTGQPYVQTTAGIFKASALLEMEKRDDLTMFDKEHIKPYFLKNYEFVTDVSHIEGWDENIKLTIDTEEDYLFIKKLFGDLYRNRPIAVEDVLEWYKNEYKNP